MFHLQEFTSVFLCHCAQYGFVIERSSAADGHNVRWNVCLADGHKLSLKEDNLELLELGMDAMVAALEEAGEHDKAVVLRSTIGQKCTDVK